MNDVTITVTNRKTGNYYQAKSYPDSDKDNDGIRELYRTPVYEIELQSGSNIKIWPCVRFMPYWNDPSAPNNNYKTLGFVNAGLHQFTKTAVSLFLPNYGTQNRVSPYRGAIQIRDNFLIHAGPKSMREIGWGSAGCVEIIGDFSLFKQDIRDLAGISNTVEPGLAIATLVKNSKLYVQVLYDTPPNFRNLMVSP
jgi:hypothetical protein